METFVLIVNLKLNEYFIYNDELGKYNRFRTNDKLRYEDYGSSSEKSVWRVGILACRGSESRCEKKARKFENYNSLNPDNLVSSSWSDDEEIIKHDKSHKTRANELENRLASFNKKKGFNSNEKDNNRGKKRQISKSRSRSSSSSSSSRNSLYENNLVITKEISQGANFSSQQMNHNEPGLDQTEPLINLFSPSAGPIDHDFKTECIQYLKEIKVNQTEILAHIRSKRAKETLVNHELWYVDSVGKKFNLLDHKADTPTQYLNSVSSILFTFEEKCAGYVPSDKKSRSNRIPLDEDKINLIKTAFWTKFRITPDKQTEKWLMARELINRHCYDCAKVKRNRESLSSGSENANSTQRL